MMFSTEVDTLPREETIDEFLARGGRIERVEHYPDPDGRVLRRGQREHQLRFNPHFSRPAAVATRRSA